jgi:2-amino-4-hydroxy-6-hydroxymethyldihydropteridine diphosphokinase
VEAVLGLGANLGDRLATLRLAVDRLSRVSEVLARSSVWESRPLGGPLQPDFLNAAVLVRWQATPIALLDETLRIEQELGRVRTIHHGPRTIDLDMLWIGGKASDVVDEARLVVPHPRLHERAFALAPLLEVAPAAVDPRSGRRYVVPADQGLRPFGAKL